MRHPRRGLVRQRRGHKGSNCSEGNQAGRQRQERAEEKDTFTRCQLVWMVDTKLVAKIVTATLSESAGCVIWRLHDVLSLAAGCRLRVNS